MQIVKHKGPSPFRHPHTTYCNCYVEKMEPSHDFEAFTFATLCVPAQNDLETFAVSIETYIITPRGTSTDVELPNLVLYRNVGRRCLDLHHQMVHDFPPLAGTCCIAPCLSDPGFLV